MERMISLLTSGRPMHQVLTEYMEDLVGPKEWARYYPRVYETGGKYLSPKVVSALIAQIVDTCRAQRMQDLPGAFQTMIPGALYMLGHQMPTLFISKDFLSAAARTDFDEEIRYMDLQLPYEAGVIMLPEGSLTHPEHGPCGFLMWSRTSKGRELIHDEMVVEMENGGIAFATVAHMDQALPWCYYSVTSGTVDTLNLCEVKEVKALGGTIIDIPTTKSDEEFIKQMVSLVLRIFLILNARPQLLREGKRTRRVEKKGITREFWTPSIIGADYKVARGGGDGTHGSPRMHWRRGHVRSQAFGPGLQMRKRIFIDPVLVNGPEEG